MNAPQTMRVLSFIKQELAARRPWPHNQKIADHMGWKNPSSVNDVLRRLVINGHLRRVNAPMESLRRWAYEVIRNERA